MVYSNKFYMRSKTTIGEGIYRMRRELKWTQGELASKVGVSRAAISQFELGDTTPSPDTLAKLVEALGEVLEDYLHEETLPDDLKHKHTSIKFINIESYELLTSFAKKLDAEAEPLFMAYSEFRIINIPYYNNIDYDFGYIIEIKGNSMAPRYPHEAQYYMQDFSFNSDDEIKFMSGVYLFVFDNKEPFFRRVVSTNAGVLTLQADATGHRMDFEIQDLKQRVAKNACLIFKLGLAIYMPAE